MLACNVPCLNGPGRALPVLFGSRFRATLCAMTRLMVAVVIALGLAAGGAQESARRTHLVIVVDGLRPDYVTPEVMPRLAAPRPTRHRLHSASFGLSDRHPRQRVLVRNGVYPEAHGLMGNTIYIPSRERDADARYREAREPGAGRAEPKAGCSLRPRSARCFEPQGKSLLAVSSGSSGATLLLNHTVATGGIVHYEFTRPPQLATEACRILGCRSCSGNAKRWPQPDAVDAYIKLALENCTPMSRSCGSTIRMEPHTPTASAPI